jgi:hypothetical protein
MHDVIIENTRIYTNNTVKQTTGIESHSHAIRCTSRAAFDEKHDFGTAAGLRRISLVTEIAPQLTDLR